jgi:hypothetical protein
MAIVLTPGSARADLIYDDDLTHTLSKDISTDHEIIGATPAGAGTILIQKAFYNNVNSLLTLGRDSGSRGTYNLSAGSLSADFQSIGENGIGIFNQSDRFELCGLWLWRGNKSYRKEANW